jgi:hypothetical protein
MTWHEKLDKLCVRFLTETDAILGAEEDKGKRLQYAAEIEQVAYELFRDAGQRLTDLELDMRK